MKSSRKKPLLIGICGGTGSGKTSIAMILKEKLGEYNPIIIHQDSYYLDEKDLPQKIKETSNYDHPAAFDWKLFIEHLRDLINFKPIEQPIYNFHTNSRLQETNHIEPSNLIIVEGILVFQEEKLRNIFDIKIFVDCDSDERFIRRLKRDVLERGRSLESIINQYLSTVKPMHLQFVEPSKRYADIIIPEGAHNLVAIETIVSRIHGILKDL